VASGCWDDGARVFDAVTGAELCHFDHGGPVRVVAFSPDGSQVATGSDDGSAQVWVADCEGLLRQAEARLTRNMTAQEWRRYFRDEPCRKTRADLPLG